ncbi:MAG: class I SAM-dependent methyltransferase [Bacteroidales bacterium]
MFVKNISMVSYPFWFSRFYDIVFYPFLHGIRKRIAVEIIAAKPKALIDMCCGTGNQIRYLKSLINTETVGIDISDNMLAIASRKSQNCRKLDATKTHFKDNRFEIAILSFILHETSHETAAKIANEAKRIVRNNGIIVIADYVFDNKTHILGKAGANFVEFLIGREHFKNYKSYIKHNLLKSYTTDLEMISEHKHLLGAVSVYLFTNNKKLSL